MGILPVLFRSMATGWKPAGRHRQGACLPVGFRSSAPDISTMGNTFGQLFRVTTWGESHGGGVGAVIDGCPPRIELSEAEFDQNSIAAGLVKARSYPRAEEDRARFSGSPRRPHNRHADSCPRHEQGCAPGRLRALAINLFVLHTPISLTKPSMEFETGRVADTLRSGTIGRVAAAQWRRRFFGHSMGLEMVAYVEIFMKSLQTTIAVR